MPPKTQDNAADESQKKAEAAHAEEQKHLIEHAMSLQEQIAELSNKYKEVYHQIDDLKQPEVGGVIVAVFSPMNKSNDASIVMRCGHSIFINGMFELMREKRKPLGFLGL